jgi:hypothetical protein
MWWSGACELFAVVSCSLPSCSQAVSPVNKSQQPTQVLVSCRSVVRSFRFAATLAASQLISTWIGITASITQARERAGQQLAAEEKKKGAGKVRFACRAGQVDFQADGPMFASPVALGSQRTAGRYSTCQHPCNCPQPTPIAVCRRLVPPCEVPDL